MRTGLPPLIPRSTFFRDPEFGCPRVSPDGSRLAWLAPDDGFRNVWLGTLEMTQSRAVTRDRRRGIQNLAWAGDSRHILCLRDRDGDENWHLWSVDIETGGERDLTPCEGAQAEIVAVRPDHPDQVLVAINDRDPRFHDLYRIDLATGERCLELENDGRVMSLGGARFLIDPAFRLRGYVTALPDGGVEVHLCDEEGGSFRRVLGWGPEDSFNSIVVGFTPDGRGLYLVTSVGSGTSELRVLDVASGRETVLASDPAVDADEVLVHPSRHHVQAVSFAGDRTAWRVLDPDVAPDFEALRDFADGEIEIVSRDYADRTWIVCFTSDTAALRYVRYDRRSRTGAFLPACRPALASATLAPMRAVEYRARDGLTIHGFLTEPPGIEPRRLPAVLLVHGGPYDRDRWGYDPMVQWLANRGYAVLQVNFRGSTGYGKAHLNASDREWGGRMHDDLVDGVRWVVDRGVADPDRVAIFGGSYGGYAVLVGLAFTPELFACGVDIVGPSNLVTWIESLPPYWAGVRAILHCRIGHPDTDQEFLESRSPLSRIDRIRRPLLVAQGAHDPRVPKAESVQMVEALRRAGKPVEYVEYADEGHGLVRLENRLDFFARAERFLAAHIGGRFEL